MNDADESLRLLRDAEAAPKPSDLVQSTGGFLRSHPAILMTFVYTYVSAVGLIYTWTLLQRFGVNVLNFANANDFLLAAFREPLPLFASFGAAVVGLVCLLRATGFIEARRAIPRLSQVTENLYENLARARSQLGERILRAKKAFDECDKTQELAEQTMREADEVLDRLDRCRRAFEAVDLAATFTKDAREDFEKDVRTYFTVAVTLFVAYSVLVPSLLACFHANRIQAGQGPRVFVQIRSGYGGESACDWDDETWLVATTQSFAFFYNQPEDCTNIIPVSNIVSIVPIGPTPANGSPGSRPTETPGEAWHSERGLRH
jgi:hypothetical protein